MDEKVQGFVSSIKEDLRILEIDIDGTEAHDIMLYEQGILTRSEVSAILNSLEDVRQEWLKGKLIPRNFEDIHEFLEDYVIKKTEIGGKMHTARSRNDQVALDIRMYVRTELNLVAEALLNLVDVMISLAEENLDSVMLFYTHTQQAQIGSFAHYLLSYVDALLRSLSRIESSYEIVNRNPLGACAIAGTSFPVDRRRTSELLGFDGLVENSVDAVSTRDFAEEAACDMAILCTQLSRIAEDIILWSSSEFNYLELSDQYASASSAMPQKKNPDTLELIRGRTGKVIGNALDLLVTVKGLPTGYNRDLQQTKLAIMNIFETILPALEIMKDVLKTLRINRKEMALKAKKSFAVAFDLAEAVVRSKGISFRESHRLVGRLVAKAISENRSLSELNDAILRRISKDVLGHDTGLNQRFVKQNTEPKAILLGRRSLGSPNPKEVKRMIASRKVEVQNSRRKLEVRIESLGKSRNSLRMLVDRYRLPA